METLQIQIVQCDVGPIPDDDGHVVSRVAD